MFYHDIAHLDHLDWKNAWYHRRKENWYGTNSLHDRKYSRVVFQYRMIKKLFVDKMIRERENEISMMLLDNEKKQCFFLLLS